MDPIPAFSKSAATGLSITAVCKNAGKKTPGQDDFFVVSPGMTWQLDGDLARWMWDGSMRMWGEKRKEM